MAERVALVALGPYWTQCAGRPVEHILELALPIGRKHGRLRWRKSLRSGDEQQVVDVGWHVAGQ